MITRQAIIEWQENAPWIDMHQVEQDLIISRALTAIFSDKYLASHLAFRGGTALHRIYLSPAARYSEDIDLVQTVAEPIGTVLNGLRRTLDFLGNPTIQQKKKNNTLVFKILSTYPPEVPIKLKIEINCTEHFTVNGFVKHPYEMSNTWYSGDCDIVTFSLDELIGTKIRALYQRRKGRDLFDLYLAGMSPDINPENSVQCFKQYITFSDKNVPSREEYLINLEKKMNNRLFVSDTEGILRPGIDYVPMHAFEVVKNTFISRI
jgi:predicted nucleotidyltransferase component of viral defense system